MRTHYTLLFKKNKSSSRVMYPYGLIGNCQVSALISKLGSIDWLCLPRPDSPPVFGKILDPEGGNFSIAPAEGGEGRQEYIRNTNILTTTFTTPGGDSFVVTDFAPRFEQFGRMYRPISIFRIVEPVKGNPAIRASCKPITHWDKKPAQINRGNSHLQYPIRESRLRLTTNMSLTYLIEEKNFLLQEPLYFALTWDSALSEDLEKTTKDFLVSTKEYWRRWVKHCSIPPLFQKEVIRSALTLKLHCYEDTGAILAALSTSLPEISKGVRNWDYRFCWLRDSYFALSAFQNLGHFEEMEGFIKFLLNIGEHEGRLRPVYALDQTAPIPEIEHRNWIGLEESQPVRENNQAAEHIQNDVYGELVLALAPIFFDERFEHLRTPPHVNLFLDMGRRCFQSIGSRDAGIWEFRDGWQVHTFTNLMSWAGLDRIATLIKQGKIPTPSYSVEDGLGQAQDWIAKSAQEGILRNGPNDTSLDSSLLLLPLVRYPDKELCSKTVLQIKEELCLDRNQFPYFLHRYNRKDDFGFPEHAFVVCSFWLAQALAGMGHTEEACDVVNRLLTAQNHLGLLSEHFSPRENKQLGNFPQAYSHVGLINAAFAVSPGWREIL